MSWIDIIIMVMAIVGAIAIGIIALALIVGAIWAEEDAEAIRRRRK